MPSPTPLSCNYCHELLRYVKWSNWLEGGQSSKLRDELEIIRLKEAMRQRDEYYLICLLITVADDASGNLSDFITTI
jgi:hypothetical protein